MECKDTREILSAILDDEASPSDSARADGHLETCEACRAYREEILEDRARLRAWQDEVPIASYDLDRILTYRPRARPAIRRWAAVAAVVVAVAAGFAAGRATVRQGADADFGSAPTPVLIENRTVYPDANEVHSVTVLAAADPHALRID